MPSINTPVHPKHYRHYSKELLIKHFIENGFTVKEILGYMYQPRWFWRPLSAVSELPVLWRMTKLVLREVEPENAKTILGVACKN